MVLKENHGETEEIGLTPWAQRPFHGRREKCKPLLQRHVIFYEETFLSEIKNIDSSFIKLIYSFHSA